MHIKHNLNLYYPDGKYNMTIFTNEKVFIPHSKNINKTCQFFQNILADLKKNVYSLTNQIKAILFIADEDLIRSVG